MSGARLDKAADDPEALLGAEELARTIRSAEPENLRRYGREPDT